MDIVYRHIVIVYCHIVIVYRRIDVVTCSSSHSSTFRVTVLKSTQRFTCEYCLQALLDIILLVLMENTYVTGYWKTDHNVTLGQLHFIGPANSHTHALSMH